MFRFQGPRCPPRFVSRGFRSRSRKVGGPFRARVNVQPATRLPACSRVGVSGISQVPRRSVLCLCLGPRPRPDRRYLAYLTVSSVLPPLLRQRRLQRENHVEAIARLQHLLLTLHEWCCHYPCKARFRLAGWPLPGGGRTLWIAKKGFRFRFSSPFPGLFLTQRRSVPAPALLLSCRPDRARSRCPMA